MTPTRHDEPHPAPIKSPTPAKRRREPDPRWAEANARHTLVAPAIERFLAALAPLLEGAPPLKPHQLWIGLDAQASGLLCQPAPLLAPLGTGPDWVAMAGLRRVLRPKFSCAASSGAGQGLPAERDLFGTLLANASDAVVVAQAAEHTVLLPARASFLLSDVKELGPLLQGGPRFRCIVVDPPWENRSVKRGRHYHTLPGWNLLGLPLQGLLRPEAEGGAVVALWVTNRERLRRFVETELLPAWGLRHVATWHWLKLTPGGCPISAMGSNHRRPYEPLLICRAAGQGMSAAPPLGEGTKHLDGRVFASVPGQHSRKPHLGHQLRELVAGGGECLEMFARELFPGWVSWGNEVLKYQVLDRRGADGWDAGR
ncbi:hypothetical protein ACKKBG_A05115 [Auxenochlorella protothecoides x Auxenochlorella symbiontica]